MRTNALPLLGLLWCAAAAPVTVLDYDRDGPPPTVWVVGTPNGSSVARQSTDHPHDGPGCLGLDYQFTAGGQYLGVAQRVRVLAPVHAVRFWVDGDTPDIGLAVYLDDVSGETHKVRVEPRAAGQVGWRDVVADLDRPHESWGGDKNGKLDLPVLKLTFEVARRGDGPAAGRVRFDTVRVDSDRSAIETLGVTIAVRSPAYGGDVRGDTPVRVSAPGLSEVTATGWAFGSRLAVATVNLDAAGDGAFVFPADRFPHGPVTVTIAGRAGPVSDRCQLQLYNTGGRPWHEGMPPSEPPAATGMRLRFADDFDRMPNIGGDGRSTYYDHKPLGGDFSSVPFANHHEAGRDPFAQRDTYLRIRADERRHSAGLISSLDAHGHGVTATVPCYFECRFTGPNAIGTWPAFWLMTDYVTLRLAGKAESDVPCDELDVIEAYGGEGLGAPNSFDKYCITPHAWCQSEVAEAIADAAWHRLGSPVSMARAGVTSTWFESPHTYGCRVTAAETTYYCDDVEMGRHPTLAVCRAAPLFFMVNLATGGGWPVDLGRYDGRADLYVDYVRVYQGER